MSQVRVSEATHELLRLLSTKEGRPMQEIIDRAVEAYRRKVFLEGLSSDYQRLRSDTKAWKEHERETRLWDSSLEDGLNDKE